MKKLFLFVFCLILASCGQAAARMPDAEVITNYHSVIEPQRDGTAVISEFITVNRSGLKIKRGIYRDLPLTGGVSYSVIAVRRDGRPEPYFTERRGKFLRINTGDDNPLPENGLYTYELRYKASNVVRNFGGCDEISWNVTGNGWAFPIWNASAEIKLPDGVKLSRQSAFVGLRGSTEKGRISGRTAFAGRLLNLHEGLTYVVRFEKRFLERPVRQEKPFPLPFSPVWGMIVPVLFYGVLTWMRFGRNPASLPVMPRFDPPEGVSAALAGYVYSYGRMLSGKYFSMAVIEGVQQGFLKMSKDGSGIVIEENRPPENEREKVFTNIFMSVFPIKFNRRVLPRVSFAVKEFERKLKKESSPYIVKNTLWTFIGVALVLGMMFLLLAVLQERTDLAVMMCPPAFFCYVAEFIIFFLIRNNEYKKRKFQSASAFFASLIFLFWPVSVLLSIQEDYSPAGHKILICTFIFELLLPVYSFLMIRLTEDGKRLSEHIKGLKMFMDGENGGGFLKASAEKTDRLLPYAVLFGMEKEWLTKTRQVLEKEGCPTPAGAGSVLAAAVSNETFEAFFDTCFAGGRNAGFGGSGGCCGGGCGGGGGGGR